MAVSFRRSIKVIKFYLFGIKLFQIKIITGGIKPNPGFDPKS